MKLEFTGRDGKRNEVHIPKDEFINLADPVTYILALLEVSRYSDEELSLLRESTVVTLDEGE